MRTLISHRGASYVQGDKNLKIKAIPINREMIENSGTLIL